MLVVCLALSKPVQAPSPKGYLAAAWLVEAVAVMEVLAGELSRESAMETVVRVVVGREQ